MFTEISRHATKVLQIGQNNSSVERKYLIKENKSLIFRGRLMTHRYSHRNILREYDTRWSQRLKYMDDYITLFHDLFCVNRHVVYLMQWNLEDTSIYSNNIIIQLHKKKDKIDICQHLNVLFDTCVVHFNMLQFLM